MSRAEPPRAVIADDEPALRADLERLLADAWPELTVAASVGDGAAALEAFTRLQPDVVFLDIRMPPPSGLEVARRVGPDTAVVFVTAYDEHAVEAFERAAVDYLVKPVSATRLRGDGPNACSGGGPTGAGPASSRRRFEALMRRLAAAPGVSALATGRTRRARGAGRGRGRLLLPGRSQVHRRGDARLRAHRAYVDHRTGRAARSGAVLAHPHRGGIVNVAAIRAARRDLRGRYRLTLKDRPEVLRVSAAYGHLFRRM